MVCMISSIIIVSSTDLMDLYNNVSCNIAVIYNILWFLNKALKSFNMNIIVRQTISLWVTFTHIEPLLKVSFVTLLDYSFFKVYFSFSIVFSSPCPNPGDWLSRTTSGNLITDLPPVRDTNYPHHSSLGHHLVSSHTSHFTSAVFERCKKNLLYKHLHKYMYHFQI